MRVFLFSLLVILFLIILVLAALVAVTTQSITLPALAVCATLVPMLVVFWFEGAGV